MKYIINEADAGVLIRDFLTKQELSKKFIKAIKMNGDILVNGTHQSVRYCLQKNDVIELIWPNENSNMEPYDYRLDIVYEDEDYLVINKKAGIPCIPTKRYPCKTIANALINYYQKHDIKATVHLVNRLDKDTQGLMLVAKNRYAHYLLSKDIKQVKRIYYCLVEGTLDGEGVINYPIIKDKDSVKRVVDIHGKTAITYYSSLKTFDNYSLVKCILETGRTHQIRVHLSSQGFPLIGDILYGSRQNQLYYLDSVYLEFVHPFTQKLITVEKDVDFQEIINNFIPDKK